MQCHSLRLCTYCRNKVVFTINLIWSMSRRDLVVMSFSLSFPQSHDIHRDKVHEVLSIVFEMICVQSRRLFLVISFSGCHSIHTNFMNRDKVVISRLDDKLEMLCTRILPLQQNTWKCLTTRKKDSILLNFPFIAKKIHTNN